MGNTCKNIHGLQDLMYLNCEIEIKLFCVPMTVESDELCFISSLFGEHLLTQSVNSMILKLNIKIKGVCQEVSGEIKLIF